MFGGRQFFMGLLLGGLGVAFARTPEGRQLLDHLAQTFVLNEQLKTVTAVHTTGEEKDIRHDDARKSDNNS